MFKSLACVLTLLEAHKAVALMHASLLAGRLGKRSEIIFTAVGILVGVVVGLAKLISSFSMEHFNADNFAKRLE